MGEKEPINAKVDTETKEDRKKVLKLKKEKAKSEKLANEEKKRLEKQRKLEAKRLKKIQDNQIELAYWEEQKILKEEWKIQEEQVKDNVNDIAKMETSNSEISEALCSNPAQNNLPEILISEDGYSDSGVEKDQHREIEKEEEKRVEKENKLNNQQLKDKLSKQLKLEKAVEVRLEKQKELDMKKQKDKLEMQQQWINKE